MLQDHKPGRFDNRLGSLTRTVKLRNESKNPWDSPSFSPRNFIFHGGVPTKKKRNIFPKKRTLSPNRRLIKGGKKSTSVVPGLSFPKGLAICEDSCDLGAPRDFRSGNLWAFSVRSVRRRQNWGGVRITGALTNDRVMTGSLVVGVRATVGTWKSLKRSV